MRRTQVCWFWEDSEETASPNWIIAAPRAQDKTWGDAGCAPRTDCSLGTVWTLLDVVNLNDV